MSRSARRTALLRVNPLEDRLTPSHPSDLDASFGSDGRVRIDFDGNNDWLAAIATAPGGKVLLAGTTQPPGDVDTPRSVGVARLNPDGAPDPTFGAGGTVVLDFGPDQAVYNETYDVAAAPDGKVVISFAPAGGGGVFLTRLTVEGVIDDTFGDRGKVALPVAESDSRALVAVQPDGKVIVAGSDGLSRARDLAVARFHPDGTLDPTFGEGGVRRIDLGESETVSSVSVGPDGRITVGSSLGLVRLTAAGGLDPTYGGGDGVAALSGHFDPNEPVSPDGQTFHSGYNTIRHVAVGSNGRAAVLTSYTSTYWPPGLGVNLRVYPISTEVPVIVRLDAGGAVVGEGPVGLDSATAATYLTDLAVQLSGAVLFEQWSSPDLDNTSVLSRLTPDLAPDSSFSASGSRVELADRLMRLAIQEDGKILVAGVMPPVAGQVGYDFAVTRLIGDPPPPPLPPPPPGTVPPLSPPGTVPPPLPVAPGPVSVGGRPDGSAEILAPSGGGSYHDGGAISFFPDFAGVVRTAVADVTGDGVPDWVGGAGPGGGPRVAVIDGATGDRVADFFAFETTFAGGVFVAAADLDGDGKAEVVVTPDRGGGPVVAVFDGSGAARARFLGIDDPAFRGGARPALGNLNGDEVPDLVVSAGSLGGPRVAVFDGKSVAGGGSPVKLLPDFFAFEPGLRTGTFVAAGDVTGDGSADLAFGGGPGGAPRVRLFDGAALLGAGAFSNLDEIGSAQRANFFAGDAGLRGGVRLAMRDADGDGRADLVAGSGAGEPSRIRVYRGTTLLANPAPAADQELDPFGAVLANGVFVG